jgi:hypothetical protein
VDEASHFQGLRSPLARLGKKQKLRHKVGKTIRLPPNNAHQPHGIRILADFRFKKLNGAGEGRQGIFDLVGKPCGHFPCCGKTFHTLHIASHMTDLIPCFTQLHGKKTR